MCYNLSETNYSKRIAFMKKFLSTNTTLTICYFALYLIIGITLLLKQPFGNPPDEYNRYLIPEYICEHGTIPNGYDEEIRIPGYGFSYGFQPILPYMLQGYAMKLISCFTDSEAALLYTGRSVNLLLGLVMAFVVLKLAKKWFENPFLGWFFAFLVTFLPQSIFVHTYVNTDSCCMLSIAIMLYGITLGLKDGFTPKTSLILSGGIILCALSYYNAYGYILSCILLFVASFVSSREGKIALDWQTFLKKGIFISAIVLIGIGWWFIRSAILYDGDFLGLTARKECGLLYAIPEFHPDTRITWENQGHSIWDMIFGSDFWTLSIMSFIGVYGPMTITTSIWIYRFYKAFYFIGLCACAVIPVLRLRTSTGLFPRRKGLARFFHGNMIFCMIVPVVLSLYYSYTTDYQPQGRYLLPALIPVCYYTIRGFEQMFALDLVKKYKKDWWLKVFVGVGLVAITLSLMIMVYGYALPYYEANPIAP